MRISILFSKYKKWGKKIGILLVWVALWELLALAIDNAFLLVTPMSAVKTLGKEFVTGMFWGRIGISVLRIATGFFLALFLGVLVAAVIYRVKLAQEFLQPLLQVLKAIPMVSFVVLLLIWWGADWLPMAISFLVSFPVIAIAVKEGLDAAKQEDREVFSLFEVPFWTRIFYLYRFSTEPFLRTALKTTPGNCFRAGVAAEVIGMTSLSMGGAIYLSKISFDTGELFAWTLVVVLLSYGFEKCVLYGFEAFMKLDIRCGTCQRTEQATDITVEHVSKQYQGIKVLQDFSQVFPKDEISTLTWVSGAGKTTLLRCIAGLEDADDGIVSAGSNVAMLFQDDRLIESQNALKNVELVCQDEALTREHLLELLPKECLTRPVRTLSGGMKRRVALARAMAAKGDIVLLDEPFTGMDKETAKKAMEYIKSNQRGRCILIATHILTEEEKP